MKQNTLFKPKPQVAPDYLSYLELCQDHEFKLDAGLLSHFRTLGLRLLLSTYIGDPSKLSEKDYCNFINNRDYLVIIYDNYCDKFNSTAYSAYKYYLKGYTYDTICEMVNKSRTQVGRYIKKFKELLSSDTFRNYLLYQSSLRFAENEMKPQVKVKETITESDNKIKDIPPECETKLTKSESLRFQASLPVLSSKECSKIIKNCQIPVYLDVDTKEAKELVGKLFSFHPNADTSFNARLVYDGNDNAAIVKIRRSLGLEADDNFNYKANSKRAFYSYVRKHWPKIASALSDYYPSILTDVKHSLEVLPLHNEILKDNKYIRAYEVLKKAGLIDEL